MSKLEVNNTPVKKLDYKTVTVAQKSVQWERSIKDQNSETGLLKPKWGWHS